MSNRAFDVAVAAVLVLLLLPAWAVCVLAVRLSSPGPAIHRAERVGRGARPFTLLKFRTMVAGAADLGPGVTAASDARITRIGRLLRRWKLDETPQLLNVLRGQMALVGPRPEDPRYVQRYTPVQRRLLAVRPGMSSPATLAFRDEELLLRRPDPEDHYVEVILPEKLAIDLAYLDRRSFAADCGVLLRTVLAVVPAGGPRAGGPPVPARREEQRSLSS